MEEKLPLSHQPRAPARAQPNKPPTREEKRRLNLTPPATSHSQVHPQPRIPPPPVLAFCCSLFCLSAPSTCTWPRSLSSRGTFPLLSSPPPFSSLRSRCRRPRPHLSPPRSQPLSLLRQLRSYAAPRKEQCPPPRSALALVQPAHSPAAGGSTAAVAAQRRPPSRGAA